MKLDFKTIIVFLVIFAVCGFWMMKCTYGGIENVGKPEDGELKNVYKSYSFKAVKDAWMSIDEVAEKLRADDIQAVEKVAKDSESSGSKKKPKVRSMFYYKISAVVGDNHYIDMADRETIMISILAAVFLLVFLITSGIFIKVHSVKDISFDNVGFNYKNGEKQP